MNNNIKIVWRKIRNEKALPSLKIAGLILAFAITIPMVCNITYQKSFDRFNSDSDRIYNVYIDEIYRGTSDIYGECPLAIGAYLKDLYPEVESTTRTKNKSDVVISDGYENAVKEDILFTEHSFIDVFSLDFISGDKRSFLNQNNEAYISTSLSEKIFGSINTVGKIVKVNEQEFTIAGIFKDYPLNSHQKFSALLPLKSYVDKYDSYSWESYEFLTYVKVKQGTSAQFFEEKSQKLISDYLVPWVKTHYNLDYVFDSENSMKLKLLPLIDIHLHGAYISSFEKESDMSVIYISFVIVLALLLIAYFNLMGFAFSKGKKHQLQLNIKRYLGGTKQDVIGAFITESLIFTVVAFGISILIFSLILQMNWSVLSNLSNIAFTNYLLPLVALFGFSCLLAVIFGSILGVYFTHISQKTKTIKVTNYSTFWLNRAMLISQLAVSIVLVASIISINKQLKYISDYDIGIDTKNTVVINQAYKVGNHYDALRNELLKLSVVENVSRSNQNPFSGITTGSFIPSDMENQTPYPFPYFQVDENYQEVLKYQIAEGRWFSKNLASDKNAVLINEAAVQKMGYKNPVGKEFYNLEKTEKMVIIGVVKDFNFQSLHHTVEPLVFRYLGDNDYYRNIVIKGNAESRELLLAEINKAWSTVMGTEHMNHYFMDDQITLLYEKEANAKRSISLFSLVAILISCFGLLGTVLNISNEKTKEIGIRKVNGAKISEVLMMLNKDFVKWVAIAFVIATPITYFVMHKWLENFAYKATLSWWIFALSGIFALGVALLTVSWQSWKAATRNPVEALRYE